MTDEYKVRKAFGKIWYNLPNGISTFSNCQTEGCKEAARGGLKCLVCAERELADMTSADAARAYVEAVKKTRKIEELIGYMFYED